MLFDANLIEFTPNATLRTLLTFVRRKEIGSGINTPGLFGEYFIGFDVAAFLVAILIEIAGIFVMTANLDTDMSIILTAAALGLDFVFAAMHHYYSCPRSLEIRRLTVGIEASHEPISEQNDFTLRKTNQYSSEYRKKKFIKYFFAIVLIGMAAAKIFGCYLANANELDIKVAAMAVGFVIVCLIHLMCSGYVFAYFIAAIFNVVQKRNYINRKPESLRSNAQKFSLDSRKMIEIFKKEGNEIKIRCHKLKKNTDGEVEMNVYGLLLDDDIRLFMDKTTAQAEKSEIALRALYFQVHQQLGR